MTILVFGATSETRFCFLLVLLFRISVITVDIIVAVVIIIIIIIIAKPRRLRGKLYVASGSAGRMAKGAPSHLARWPVLLGPGR